MTTSMAPIGRVLRDRVGEALAHAQARLVHRDAVHDRVGPREVDVLERARHELRVGGALLGVQVAVEVDEDGLAGLDVADDLELAVLEHERLGRHDPLVRAVLGLARAEDQRADAERVAEGQQAVAGDQRDRGVRALDALVHARDRLEDLLGLEVDARDRGLQLVGEHVDEQLGVGARVEVPAVLVEELVGQLTRVGEVAVVDEHDAVRRVDVEGLRLFFARCRALRRVAHVAEADLAEQRPHVTGAERLAHLPPGLGDVEDAAALGGGDARRVLPAMLQQEQGVVDLLVGGPAADHPDDSAHGCQFAPSTAGPSVGTVRVGADEAHRSAVDALGALFEVAVGPGAAVDDTDLPGGDAVGARGGCRGLAPSRRRRRRGTRCRGSRCPRSTRGRGRRDRRARGTPGAATTSTGRPRPRCPAAARARGWRRCRRR